MILYCKKCSAEISGKNVNIKEGIAQCGSCGEVFRIAHHLKDDEELRRIKKPLFSNVIIEKVLDETTIEIPPQGWAPMTWFMLVFTIFWNVISWTTFLGSDKGAPPLFFIPFIVVGISTLFTFLFMIKGKIKVVVNSFSVSVSRELFNLKWKKSRNTADLEMITQDVMYTRNYQPVYGIGLFFKKSGKLKFGSGLKEDERKWLIGELNELKSQYASKTKTRSF